ncbi:MAG: HepT-like ribonuclease domain-containing protein [Actinomycetes bacterium]
MKRIPAEVVATEPGTPWRDIGTMRDRLAHRYFDTLHSIVQSTVENDLRPLEKAVLRLPVAAGSDEASCLLGRLWVVTVRPQGVSTGQPRVLPENSSPQVKRSGERTQATFRFNAVATSG